jgi:rubrerythrin
MTDTQTQAQLVAELNDLLQLDHDAVQAYGLAIEAIQSPEHRQTLLRFRGDHERHIENLTELIEAHEGIPIQLSHLPTGPMKLAVQAAGNAGGDREVLLAFKANERQVRDKYQRLSDEPHAPDVAEVLNRNAADEERHYAWVSQVLERMGAGPDTGIGRAEEVFETAHGRMADLVEGAERSVMARAERMRRSPVPAILLGLAVALILGKILRQR